MTKGYPSFVKTNKDKSTYDFAVEQRWHPWVLYASDLRAIENGCYFDIQAAQKVEAFFLLLRHSKGEFAGKQFILQDFQRDRIIYPLYGWKRRDGSRRFRRGLIFTAKKSGKTSLASGLSLYHLVADGEAGAECYNAAVDRSSAMNCMTEAMNMVKSSPTLAKRLDLIPTQKRIVYAKTNSIYQALSADADVSEGKNISFLIYDELHATYGRDLYRALMGGGVSRRQPLMLIISTAGRKAEGNLCYEEYLHAKAVLSGIIQDESYFAFVAEGDPNLAPSDEGNLKRANPGLGVSPKLSSLMDIWTNAQGSPEKLNDFKQYHLNMWVQAASGAILLDVWDKGGEPFDPEELLGRPCIAGLDIGAVSDLTALVLLFPEDDGSYKVLPFFWCPEDRSRDRGQKKVSYLKWIEEGLLETTSGSVTDYKQVRARINEICARYQVQSMAVDHLYQGMQLASELLNEDGLPIVSYRNGVMTMAPPTRQFMELVMAGKLRHNGNPVLRWMAGNLVMKKDHTGNLMPDKAKSHEKIDGITATIMALGVAGLTQSKKSYYEDHDIFFLGEGNGNDAVPPPEITKPTTKSPRLTIRKAPRVVIHGSTVSYE